MRKILIMDAQTYDTALPEFCRTAVRGIIFIDGKLVLRLLKESLPMH